MKTITIDMTETAANDMNVYTAQRGEKRRRVLSNLCAWFARLEYAEREQFYKDYVTQEE